MDAAKHILQEDQDVICMPLRGRKPSMMHDFKVYESRAIGRAVVDKVSDVRITVRPGAVELAAGFIDLDVLFATPS